MRTHSVIFISALFLACKSSATTENDLIKRGEYLARAADCQVCHTAIGGQPYGGGYAIQSPFGKIYGPNISSDIKFGIGSWTDEEFIRAVRDGIGKNGEALYPAMPYDAYTKMHRDDVLAIKAWLLSLPGVKQTAPATALPFPFNQRWGLTLWQWVNFHPGELKQDPQQSEEWNRGRYLTEALAHCGSCHSPRNFMMGIKSDAHLSGGEIDGWVAFNITGDKTRGIGSWTTQELVTYLKTGFVAGKASASGPMAEAISHSLQYLPETDLTAIARYLQTVKTWREPLQKQARDSFGKPDTNNYLISYSATEDPFQLGRQVYLSNCASCHGITGSGSGEGFHAYPSLYHHTVTGAWQPQNLISVILNGVQRHMTQGEIMMPGFAKDLDDKQIALLSNYIRKQFGDKESEEIQPKLIGKIRKDLALPSPPVYLEGSQP